MFALHVGVDLPVEEIQTWLEQAPACVWYVLGGLLYALGFVPAGRAVAGLGDSAAWRLAKAAAWPVSLALFLGCRGLCALGRTLTPAAQGAAAALAPKGAAGPFVDSMVAHWTAERAQAIPPQAPGRPAGT